MSQVHEKSITLVIVSLPAGGAERIMSTLANQFVAMGVKVNLVLLMKQPRFYQLDERIRLIEPDFFIDQMGKARYTLRNFFWLRKLWKKLRSDAVLSFGGKYNSFVLLSALGKGQRIFVSDRSRPNISYGKVLDRLNPMVYRTATGIVAQTGAARKFAERSSRHPNVQVIPNPLPVFGPTHEGREKIILNVGRFIFSKHQDWLVDYFEQLDAPGWRLQFVGDGPLLDEVKARAERSPKHHSIEFLGNQSPVLPFYRKAGIFAFTSTSEGFPNSLGEAMSAGCPVVSFDCEAGPADLIDAPKNGILVEEGNHHHYLNALQALVDDPERRASMGKRAAEKIAVFDEEKIAQRYLNFLLEL